MIARPVNRPRPIPFDEVPTPGSTVTRPVSWAASSGPAQPGVASLAVTPAPTLGVALSAARAPALAPIPAAPAPLRRSPVLVASPATPKTNAKHHHHHQPHGELSARYVGQGALSVRSSVTGRHYRFQGHGDSQKIDKHDLLLLKRIPDLIVS